MGQAIVALSGNPSGIFVNPAASGFSESRSLNVMGVQAFGMASYVTLGGSFESSSAIRWTVQSAVLSISGIPEHPNLQGITSLEARRDSIRSWVKRGFSSFGDVESALLINGSKSINKTVDLGWQISPFDVQIPVGFTVRILNKQLGSLTGTGIGADFGGMITIPLNDIFLWDRLGHLTLGGAWLNLFGTRVYWNSRKVDLIPAQFIHGVGYEQPIWDANIILRILEQTSTRYPGETLVGTELLIGHRLAVRLGLNQSELQGGIGISLTHDHHNLTIDYSFASHALGPVHRLGVVTHF